MMKNIVRMILLSAALAALAGCQSVSSVFHSDDDSAGTVSSEKPAPTGPVQRIPFPADEYQKLARSGSSSIVGQVFSTRDGKRYAMTGPEILAVPVTSYSRQAYEALQQNRKISPADPRAQKYTLRTLGNDAGKFEFNGLAAGSYYLITTAHKDVSEGDSYSRGKQVIQQEVGVGKGQTSKVTLAP
ncbi:hypothetical protein R84981_002189 [Carnimonas sp. R-84981]|uniref:hypothetical protein n=1 Tax=Carnimonas bestiolae TaxID=3402172 RepID=UPI003EDC4A3A